MRFGFDVLELRKFKLSVKSKATGTPLKGVFKAPALSLGISMPCVNVGRLSYIGVGLSALLVSADRAMREPRYVERAADWLHVFLYVLQNEFGQFGAIDGSVIS